MDLRQKLALRRATTTTTTTTTTGTPSVGEHTSAVPSAAGPARAEPPARDTSFEAIAERRAAEAQARAPRVAPAEPPEGHDEAHIERVSRLREMLNQMIARQKARDKVEGPPARRAPALTPEGAVPAALLDRSRRHHLRTGPLPGGVVDTEHGPMHVVTTTFEPHHCHGKVGVAAATRARPETVAKLALDVRLCEPDPRRYLYLDTETTGLMGGTGTIPFLTGLAWFDDETLTVEQILLRTPADEPAMLHHLSQRLARASAIVTYNGKSFDWPLIKSRYILNRLPPPPDPLHLDLLHASRRVFRRRLGEVRLTTLERALLGFRREYDVDGHEIPALYWSMIRSADGSLLTPVVEHNINDLVALAGVLATLVDRFETLRPSDDPSDHLGLAHVAARADDPARARAFAHAAAAGGGAEHVTTAALALSARLALAADDHLEALRLYREALAGASPTDAPALHLALAKLYEHQLRDPASALTHAASTGVAESAEVRERRVQRLSTKVARLEAQAQRTASPARRRRARAASSSPTDAEMSPTSAPLVESATPQQPGTVLVQVLAGIVPSGQT